MDRHAELAEAASKIGIELRNQYLIHYKPATENRDGKYHKVVVKIVPDRPYPDLKLAWRRGYYAPAD